MSMLSAHRKSPGGAATPRGRTRRTSSMSTRKANADPSTRHKTRYRGISYRVRADGSRTYAVYHAGRYSPVDGGEQDALSKQAELRGQTARGQAPTKPTKLTFNEVAEQWLESKHRLRPYTLLSYRSTLDRVLVPRFDGVKLEIGRAHV